MHPDRIGSYRISRKIGSGGMGNVYLGIHEETGEEAAIKVLPTSMAREDGFVIRFSREIEALKTLSSPYIVKLFQNGTSDDGSYYYSMEFVDGETLTAMISRRKKLPWQEVIEISLQIALALKAAHNAGIVHRDLKPSNLMLTKDGNIKLTDFGVAHMFATTRLTRTGGVVGTAEYMSPEQARGQRATKHSDLYSLGAVMYAMLTGRPPFTGKMANDILHKHQFAQFDKPSHYVPELPRLLEDFVCTLLQKKPGDRFPDGLVAIKQLENVRARIEFATRADAETAIGNDEAASDHTADRASDHTVGATADDGKAEHRPGSATMVRNFVRDDIERQFQQSPVAKFFDNTVVLLTLFAVVIAAGIYLSRDTVPDPAEELAAAEETLFGDATPAWLRVRDETLIPLLDADVLPDRRADLETWIRRVDQYEFCRDIRISTPSDPSVDSELQRLIRHAFQTYADGDIADGRTELETVHEIIRDDPNYTYLAEFATATLHDWGGEQNIAGRRSFVATMRVRAETLVADSEIGRAAAILRSTIKLYQQDATVARELTDCRRLLQQLETAAENNQGENSSAGLVP
ncbi:MAG: serine/threonine-protein kinase [Fuerstiella sp.]